MQLLRWNCRAEVEGAVSHSYAFLRPSRGAPGPRTQLAGIAQYSRVDHTKRFLPSYIPRRLGLGQSRSPHGGRYRSANRRAPHAQSSEGARTGSSCRCACVIWSHHCVCDLQSKGQSCRFSSMRMGKCQLVLLMHGIACVSP
jgi:hypothetical protein